jgi:hypothetical protein
MYFFCNSIIHVITLYSGDVCVVLCINASVFGTSYGSWLGLTTLLQGAMSQWRTKGCADMSPSLTL